MFRKLRKNRGQSALEYSVLLAIIVGAIVVMQVYIKRGVQGRLQESTDEIGDQFDPGYQSYDSNANTVSKVLDTTTTAGVTTQNIQNQKTLRWGSTKTNVLSKTDWGNVTR